MSVKQILKKRQSKRFRILALALILCQGLSIAIAQERPALPADPPALSEASTTYPALYIAAMGDDVWTLARRYKTTPATLMELNPGLTPAGLHEGDALIIPKSWDQPPEIPRLEKELYRGLRGRKQIAITIDVAWVDAEALDTLLETLRTQRVRASFFLTGIFLNDHPQGAQRIASHGHTLHNHSQTHPDFTKLTPEQITRELRSVEKAIAPTSPTLSLSPTVTTSPTLAIIPPNQIPISTSNSPFNLRPSSLRYWRSPFGARDRRVLWETALLGYRSVYWTIDAIDWPEDPPPTPESIFQRVCIQPFEKNPDDPDPLDGAIILFHASGVATPQALERIIVHLREKGYRFVTLATLIRP